MKEITDDTDIKATHTFFFNTNVEHETEFAFLVKCLNKKGALSTNWIPKSRLKVMILKRRDQKPPHEMIDIKKYYAPNHFIK